MGESELEGFSADRKKKIMGKLLKNEDGNVTMERVVRVVLPVRHVALLLQGRPTSQVFLRIEADVYPFIKFIKKAEFSSTQERGFGGWVKGVFNSPQTEPDITLQYIFPNT